MEETNDLLARLIDSLDMEPLAGTDATALVSTSDGNLAFRDDDAKIKDAERFVNSLIAFLANVSDLSELVNPHTVLTEIETLIGECDKINHDYIHDIVRAQSFRNLETNWRSLYMLSSSVTSDEIVIDFVDVKKEELGTDLEDHDSDILTSALFKKVYVEEYDRYGGRPFGSMLGLYYFDASDDEDVRWLSTMSKVSRAAHCPFIASANAECFDFKDFSELSRAQDLEDLMSLPKYGPWNAFRKSDGAAYIGLTLPRFMIRKPWQANKKNPWLKFDEDIRSSNDYLWGSAAVLFARNMLRSFEASEWCQHITGPRGGGEVLGLPVHLVEHHGHEELQLPVEVAIPDFRELQFAKCGFIPLVHEKNSANAAFFSARAVKIAIEFEEEINTQNADLVCNLSYTLSITRIAHYVKRMVRDYIGSTADGPYIQDMLSRWLIEYVTTVTNPDDLTLLYYPFQAVQVEVTPKPGPLGWYNCIISILPHIQFQGMDVELRLEAALGG